MIRRTILACVVLTTLGLPLAGRAEEGAPSHGGAHHPTGITNWWSWDYGPTAKDPEHRSWPAPFGFAVINFLVFAGILYRLAAKPIRGYVRERHESIRKDLDEAARLREEAQRKLTEYETKILGMDREIEALLSGIRAEAEADKVRIIEAAEAQARRMKTDAENQIAAEIERARRELREHVVTAALKTAQDVLTKEVAAEDERRLAESYVTSVEKSLPTTPKGRSA